MFSQKLVTLLSIDLECLQCRPTESSNEIDLLLRWPFHSSLLIKSDSSRIEAENQIKNVSLFIHR